MAIHSTAIHRSPIEKHRSVQKEPQQQNHGPFLPGSFYVHPESAEIDSLLLYNNSDCLK